MALALYLLLPEAVWRDAASPLLWVFVVVLMLGVIAGNIRGIALPTLVTLLVPEHLRDRANGLVGTTTGVSFLATSVISGLLVAFDGMRSTILLAMVVSLRRRSCTSPGCGSRNAGWSPPATAPTAATASTSRAPSAWCGACPGCSP